MVPSFSLFAKGWGIASNLHQSFEVFADPLHDPSEAELGAVERTVNEFESLLRIDIDVNAIAPQKYISRGEGDAFIAVYESMVIRERFHQRRRFFFGGGVVADLRAKDRGLNRTWKDCTQDSQKLLPISVGTRRPSAIREAHVSSRFQETDELQIP
jgi:hypothetical protein